MDFFIFSKGPVFAVYALKLLVKKKLNREWKA